MRKYRITFRKSNGEIIFTTVALCKSMRGAEQKARNIAPFEWQYQKIVDLTSEWKLKLDKLEFNY